MYQRKVNLVKSIWDIVNLSPHIIARPYCTSGDFIARDPSVEKPTGSKSMINPGQNYEIPIKLKTIEVHHGSSFHNEQRLRIIEHVVMSNTSNSKPFASKDPPEDIMSDISGSRVVPKLLAKSSTSKTIPCQPDSGEERAYPTAPGNGSIPRWPRIRPEPTPTFFCLIPKYWAKSFNEKTGITGFWTLIFTTGTFLFSKEIMVAEHNFYNGISAALLCYFAVKYVGPVVAKMIDKGIDEYEAQWNNERTSEIQALNNQINNEKKLQLHFAEQTSLVKAKREMVDLQLEDEFRKRQFAVYTNVMNKLNYHVAVEHSMRRYAQENMVEWLVNQVKKSINDDFDAKYFDLKVDELELLGQSRL